MGDHAARPRLGASHHHQIIVDVVRKPYRVKGPRSLARGRHSVLLRLKAMREEKGTRTCHPGDDELAATDLGCCEEHERSLLWVKTACHSVRSSATQLYRPEQLDVRPAAEMREGEIVAHAASTA